MSTWAYSLTLAIEPVDGSPADRIVRTLAGTVELEDGDDANVATGQALRDARDQVVASS